MKVKILNIDSNILYINDLGIILSPGEYTYLDHFNEINILESIDLKTAIDSLICEVSIEEEIYDYKNFLLNYEKITKLKHENLNTLTHNLSENAFMKTTKTDNQVKFITYFTSSQMIQKTREEEIVRDANGKSMKIISRIYDSNEELVSTEEQILNRDIDGKVESITLVKI